MQLFPNNIQIEIPIAPHLGAFGAMRKHDIHTGVDLYAEEGTPVFATEKCKVVDVSYFTGPNAIPSCPWWLETFAVTVKLESNDLFLLYGEIDPAVHLYEELEQGSLIGFVKRVLRKDKGLPTSMLHVEMYDKILPAHPYWEHGKSKPDGLLDPTEYIKQFI